VRFDEGSGMDVAGEQAGEGREFEKTARKEIVAEDCVGHTGHDILCPGA